MNMWVKSPNNKPVFLLDTSTMQADNPKEYFYLSISAKEAEAGISKEVPANKFFHDAIGRGVICAHFPPVEKPVEIRTQPRAYKKGKKGNEDN